MSQSTPEHDQSPKPTPDLATTAPAVAVKERQAPPKLDKLPPFRVLLHNDDINTPEWVVETIMELTPHPRQMAIYLTLTAHNTGISLLLMTHKERAELYQEQFTSKGLTVTIEPAE